MKKLYRLTLEVITYVEAESAGEIELPSVAALIGAAELEDCASPDDWDVEEIDSASEIAEFWLDCYPYNTKGEAGELSIKDWVKILETEK